MADFLLTSSAFAARGTVRPLARLEHAPDTGGLAQGEAAPLEGRNDFGSVGYRAPCSPRGRHRYRFRLHALAEELRLTPGTGVAELERVLTGNLLAVAELVGTYER